MTEVPVYYDVYTDETKPITQEVVNKLFQLVRLKSARPTWPGQDESRPLPGKLKVYPNTFRFGYSFVMEDKEIKPYPDVTDLDGKPVYPQVPLDANGFNSDFPDAWAHELVRRWNLEVK